MIFIPIPRQNFYRYSDQKRDCNLIYPTYLAKINDWLRLYTFIKKTPNGYNIVMLIMNSTA